MYEPISDNPSASAPCQAKFSYDSRDEQWYGTGTCTVCGAFGTRPLTCPRKLNAATVKARVEEVHNLEYEREQREAEEFVQKVRDAKREDERANVFGKLLAKVEEAVQHAADQGEDRVRVYKLDTIGATDTARYQARRELWYDLHSHLKASGFRVNISTDDDAPTGSGGMTGDPGMPIGDPKNAWVTFTLHWGELS